jgi:hypothetical protein
MKHTGKTEDHHGPGRGLGNRGDVEFSLAECDFIVSEAQLVPASEIKVGRICRDCVDSSLLLSDSTAGAVGIKRSAGTTTDQTVYELGWHRP